jgi:hypothetical protein
MKILITTIVLMFALESILLAQNILTSNLQWETSEATDLRTGSTRSHQSVFKTYSNQKITWEQRNGAHITTYQIQTIQGDWAQVENIGKVVYVVERDGKTGEILFERNESGLFVTLDFSKADEHAIKQRFHISTVR